jgi:hypothetical protein
VVSDTITKTESRSFWLVWWDVLLALGLNIVGYRGRHAEIVLNKGNAIELKELRKATAFYSSPDQGGWQLISSPGLRKKQAAKSCAHYTHFLKWKESTGGILYPLR